jgi:hypothetical protein
LSTAGQPHARENDSALGDARVYDEGKAVGCVPQTALLFERAVQQADA